MADRRNSHRRMLVYVVGVYKEYLGNLCAFLVQSKVSEAVQLMQEIENNPEQAGYLLEKIYWYYSQLERAQTGSRLLGLPFSIGKNTENEMKRDIKAEYLLYKHNIEPLYDWTAVQEAEDFDLPTEGMTKEELEEVAPVVDLDKTKEKVEPEQTEVELDMTKEKVEPKQVEIEDSEDLDDICDIPEEVLDEKDDEDEEDEPALGVSSEDMYVEQTTAFDFLSKNEDDSEEEDEATTMDADGYYSGLFADTSGFRKPTMEEILQSQRNIIPKHDTEMMQTEYKREAIFREKMYTWYEKLESLVKF